MSELRLEAGGVVFSDWTSAEIARDIANISGTFRVDYDDQLRIDRLIPRAEARRDLVALQPLTEARLYLDGELVLVGWIEDVEFEISGDQVRASISGRDRTGFLVDCSANPNGPAEYKGLTVLQIAAKLCAPFGISVRAEVDVGAPLADYGLDVGETVMSAIDKAAKQRAVMVTSDGIGGLVLTRSGARRAPAALSVPGNAISAGARLSSRERFSDYWVKGQARHQRGGHQAALDGTAMPLTARAPEGSSTSSHSRRAVSTTGLDGTAYPLDQPGPPITTYAQREHAAIIGTGHAKDPAIAPFRPKVFVSRSQSGGAPNQVLAEWRMRIARGQSTRNRWTVAGWRAGPAQGGLARLWRPNETVSIIAGSADPYDALIAGVRYARSDEGGSVTQIEVVGREAYDMEPLPDQHRRHGHGARGANVANTGQAKPR